jgi:hypothetical protein
METKRLELMPGVLLLLKTVNRIPSNFATPFNVATQMKPSEVWARPRTLF